MSYLRFQKDSGGVSADYCSQKVITLESTLVLSESLVHSARPVDLASKDEPLYGTWMH